MHVGFRVICSQSGILSSLRRRRFCFYLLPVTPSPLTVGERFAEPPFLGFEAVPAQNVAPLGRGYQCSPCTHPCLRAIWIYLHPHCFGQSVEAFQTSWGLVLTWKYPVCLLSVCVWRKDLCTGLSTERFRYRDLYKLFAIHLLPKGRSFLAHIFVNQRSGDPPTSETQYTHLPSGDDLGEFACLTEANRIQSYSFTCTKKGPVTKTTEHLLRLNSHRFLFSSKSLNKTPDKLRKVIGTS
jgi:hypothetical protein